jgi:hypothetical protein
MNDNPKLRKNGGKGTLMGNLMRGVLKLGKTVSPTLSTLIGAVTGVKDFQSIEHQLAEEGFNDNELKFLLAELDKDKTELIEITKRWESDNKSGSWLSKNVRPMTLMIYNIALLLFIYCDSYVEGFDVKSMWINILLSNTGIINTAYFGSRYLEKRDSKKYQ